MALSVLPPDPLRVLPGPPLMVVPSTPLSVLPSHPLRVLPRGGAMVLPSHPKGVLPKMPKGRDPPWGHTLQSCKLCGNWRVSGPADDAAVHRPSATTTKPRPLRRSTADMGVSARQHGRIDESFDTPCSCIKRRLMPTVPYGKRKIMPSPIRRNGVRSGRTSRRVAHDRPVPPRSP